MGLNHLQRKKIYHFIPRKFQTTQVNNLLPLDVITGAACAFSVRLLTLTYTGYCLKVRRSSDNTTQDIGFSGIDLDTASLLSFCGAGDGFIDTWYDQSGNGNNLYQTAATVSQPKIVSSGAVLSENTKPYLNFDGSNDYLNLTTAITVTNQSQFVVAKRPSAGTIGFMGLSHAGVTNPPYGPWPFSDNNIYAGNNSGHISVSNAIARQYILSSNIAGSAGNIRLDGGIISTTYSAAANANQHAYAGRRGSNYSTGYAQEVIHFTSMLTESQQVLMHHMLNRYFKVY